VSWRWLLLLVLAKAVAVAAVYRGRPESPPQPIAASTAAPSLAPPRFALLNQVEVGAWVVDDPRAGDGKRRLAITLRDRECIAWDGRAFVSVKHSTTTTESNEYVWRGGKLESRSETKKLLRLTFDDDPERRAYELPVTERDGDVYIGGSPPYRDFTTARRAVRSQRR
jgi:hypothetical protein